MTNSFACDLLKLSRCVRYPENEHKSNAICTDLFINSHIRVNVLHCMMHCHIKSHIVCWMRGSKCCIVQKYKRCHIIFNYLNYLCLEKIWRTRRADEIQLNILHTPVIIQHSAIYSVLVQADSIQGSWTGHNLDVAF